MAQQNASRPKAKWLERKQQPGAKRARKVLARMQRIARETYAKNLARAARAAEHKDDHDDHEGHDH